MNWPDSAGWRILAFGLEFNGDGFEASIFDEDVAEATLDLRQATRANARNGPGRDLTVAV